tara:strand:+ start:1840 stop:3768 length:1929 start_codon:yes stop_codon:yes gene_type:complete
MASFSKANRLFNEKKFKGAKKEYLAIAELLGFDLVKFNIEKCDQYLSIDNDEKVYSRKTTYTPFFTKEILLPNDIEKYKKTPSVLPAKFQLPPLRGLANDYTFLENHIDGRQKPCVSIVILNYNRDEPLRKTLIGILKQDYDKNKLEVIVVDDGSHTDTISIVKEFDDVLDIKYFWHPDIGFTPSVARNAGVKLAKNDFIILLDVDMYPRSNLVSEYTKYHKIIKDVVLIGPRKYVNIDHIRPESFMKDSSFIERVPLVITNNDVAGKIEGTISVDWRLSSFHQTNFLKSEKLPFRFFAAGNVAFSREEFFKIGGFDERFRAWGYEDGEVAFRFFNNGKYFIPVMEALAYHQEPKNGENETDRSGGKSITAKHYASVCPYYRHLAKDEKIDYEVPKVSIYIPAYNAEKTIVDAVESVLMQTYQDIEVCICDDGSSDNTVKVLESLYKDNKKVRWTTQTNKGIGGASNTAVAMCRGIYIGQLDSDDILAKDVVEKCVSHLEKDMELGLVYTSYENQNIDGTIKPGYNYPVFTREKLTTAMIAHHFRMFRRRDWARAGGFNEHIKNAVDFDFYLKLSEKTKALHLNIIGYRRRIHGQNTSVINNTEQNKNAMKVVNDSLKRQGLSPICQLESDSSPKLLFNIVL